MVPCGTWLESEMKKQTPPGFRMAFFLPPRVSGGKGEPTSVQVGAEPWLLPTRGRNTALAVDYFKYLTSKQKAREFVLEKKTLTAIKGSADGEVPLSLRGPAQALRDAKVTWSTRYSQWYKAFDEAAKTALSGLLLGQVKAQAFVDQLEAAATKTRNDPNVPKHKA